MSLTVKTLFDVNETKWNKNISIQSFSTAYQMSGFYDPHKLAFGSKQFYIIVENNSNKILAQLTGVIHFKDFWSDGNEISKSLSSKINLNSMIVWNHGPIIHDYTEIDKILELILAELDKIAITNKINLIKGTSAPLSTQFSNSIFQKFEYTCKPWITNVTHFTKKSDEFFLDLHNKTRYDIRMGEKNGLEFEIINDRKALDEYSELKLKDWKNKDEKIKQNELFRNYRWDTSIKKNYEKVYFARLNGEVVAGMANFLFNNNVVQRTIANASQRNFYAGSFLTWNSIKWAIDNNFSTYDMGGSNPNPSSKKEKGIKHFKAKWCGKEYSYIIYTKVFNKRKTQLSKVIKQPSLLSKKFSKLISK